MTVYVVLDEFCAYFSLIAEQTSIYDRLHAVIMRDYCFDVRGLELTHTTADRKFRWLFRNFVTFRSLF